jgi:hypothetical protein
MCGGWAFIGQPTGAAHRRFAYPGLDSIAEFFLFAIGEPAIVTTLKVPKTGGLPTTKVNIVRWLKKEGEAVKRGDAVVELETEKVNYELDSPADGVLLKILTREGAEVPVGDPVCHIGESGDKIPQH